MQLTAERKALMAALDHSHDLERRIKGMEDMLVRQRTENRVLRQRLANIKATVVHYTNDSAMYGMALNRPDPNDCEAEAPSDDARFCKAPLDDKEKALAEGIG